MDLVKGFIGTLMEGFANSWLADALGWWIGLLYGWTSGLVNFLATWWMGLSPLAVGEGSATDRVSSSTSFLVPIIGLAATLFAVAKAGKADADDGKDASEITTGLMRLFFVSAAGVTGTYMLMQFSSALAPWLFEVITAGAGDDRKLISESLTDSDTDLLASVSGAGYFFALPVMVFAAMSQAAMAVGTDVGAAILSAVLPLTAAASVTEKGKEAFAKQVGWILSCVCFKPASAVIYGFGVALIQGSNIVPSITDSSSAGPFLTVLIGTMTLILAACALPALVKLINPSPSILGAGGSRFMSALGGAAVGAGIAALRMSGGSVTGSSSSAGSAANGAAVNAGSSVGAAGSLATGAATGGVGAAAGVLASGASKVASGVQKGAEAAAEGVSGASESAGGQQRSGSQSGSGAQSAAASAGAGGAGAADSSSSGGGTTSSPSAAEGNSGAAPSAGGAPSDENSTSPSKSSSAGGLAQGGAEVTEGSSNASSSSPAGSPSTESSGTGNATGATGADDTPTAKIPVAGTATGTSGGSGTRTKATGARPASASKKTRKSTGSTSDMGYRIQNAARAAAEDTEGAINPEGAEQ